MSVPTWDEIAEDEFWERVPTDSHEGSIRNYLGTNGDAIDDRVATLKAIAEKLLATGFAGPSIVASVTAIEVMIQYFCIRPLVQGVFLSDLIAFEVAERIIPSRSAQMRPLLEPLLKPWKIDLKGISLPTGHPLWLKILDPVTKVRNAFVHRGDPVQDEDAKLALECVRVFREEVVLKIAAFLEFTLVRTGSWARVIHGPGGGGSLGGETMYGATSPFS